MRIDLNILLFSNSVACGLGHSMVVVDRSNIADRLDQVTLKSCLSSQKITSPQSLHWIHKGLKLCLILCFRLLLISSDLVCFRLNLAACSESFITMMVLWACCVEISRFFVLTFLVYSFSRQFVHISVQHFTLSLEKLWFTIITSL